MKKVLPSNAITIPDKAERVFKGQIFDVYQWQQKMFDGSIKTYEMVKRIDTIQVIAIEGDKLILTVDEQPGRPAHLQFPGGRPDPEDKSWLDTAKRELLEETGKTFGDWRLISVVQIAPKIEFFVPIFLCQNLLGQQAQSLDEGGEKIEVKLQDFDEVRRVVMNVEDQTLSYLAPLFSQVDSLEKLIGLPEFVGQIVDR